MNYFAMGFFSKNERAILEAIVTKNDQAMTSFFAVLIVHFYFSIYFSFAVMAIVLFLLYTSKLSERRSARYRHLDQNRSRTVQTSCRSTLVNSIESFSFQKRISLSYFFFFYSLVITSSYKKVFKNLSLSKCGIRTFTVNLFVGSFAAIGRIQMLATILALVALLVPWLESINREIFKHLNQ